MHRLDIIATGKKNEKSISSEVWLTNISYGDESFTSDLSQICTGDWEIKEDSLLSMNNQPSRLKCSIVSDSDVHVRFISHDWSGEVRLELDQKEIVKEDLFSLTHSIREVVLEVEPSKRYQLLSVGFILGNGIWVGLLLYIASVFLITKKGSASLKRISQPGIKWYWYTLPILIVWVIYLLAFWPGAMSPDSINQWRQLTYGQFSDWHPVFHTITMWLITRLWFSPAMVALTQILAMGVLIGVILEKTRSLGAPGWLNWLVVLLIIISPAYGILIITLWKDVAYSISILGLTYLVLLVIETNGDWIKKPASWVVLGGTGALVALFRHNGLPSAFITLGALPLFYRMYWKKLFAAFILSLGLWIGVRGPLYHALDVRKNTNPGLELAIAHLVARHVQADTPMTPEERQFLATIRWGNIWPYNCYVNNELAFDGRLNKIVLRDHAKDLASLAAKLTWRRPMVTVEHLACNSSEIYQINQPPGSFYEYLVYEIVTVPIGQGLGLKSESLLPGIQSFILTWNSYISSPRWKWFFLRSPFWMYFMLFAVTVAAIGTRKWKYFLVLLPSMLNALPLSFFAVGQAFRYVFPIMIVSIILSGYLLLKR